MANGPLLIILRLGCSLAITDIKQVWLGQFLDVLQLRATEAWLTV